MFNTNITSEDEALSLLNGKFERIDFYKAKEIDQEAGRFWKRDPVGAYVDRILAARNFTENYKFSNGKINFVSIKYASYSYQKAASNADELGWNFASIVCRIRACNLLAKLFNESKIPFFKESQDYLLKKLAG